MGRLRDALKSLGMKLGINIEGHLINLEIKRERQVTIKQGDHSTLNILFVDPKTTDRLLDSPEISSTIRKGPQDLGIMTREDLAVYDSFTLAAQELSRNNLKCLKEIISKEDLTALSISMTIRRFELAGQGMKAIQYKKHLKHNFDERGNRIYNLYSSGLFYEIFEGLLAYVQFCGTISDKKVIRTLWDACLSEMDYAIFVNSEMTQERIIETLQRRFRIEGIPAIFVFGRTSQIIRKIKKAISKFLELEQEHQLEKIEYVVEMQELPVGDHDVIIIRIKIKK